MLSSLGSSARTASSESPGSNSACPSPANNENPGSPFIDVEGLTSSDDGGDEDEEEDSQQDQPGEKMKREEEVEVKTEDEKVLSLAEQFIAAMPDRIKNESDMEQPMVLCPPPAAATACCSSASNLSFSQSEDLGVESMTDDLDLADLGRA